jgi:predicted transcriptional regulator
MATAPRKGLVPARKVGSAPDNKAVSPYKIASGYGTAIGLGDPVKLHTDGTIVKATNGADAIGVFHGVRYVDAQGNIVHAKMWVASTTGTNIEALVMDDPMTTFHVKGEGPVTLVQPGDIFALNLGAADAATGRSTVTAKVLAEVTGSVALPASGSTALVGNVAGMADGDTFTIKTSDQVSATTISIATATTRDQFLAALNAVEGIEATLTTDRYINIVATNGYDLVLATGVQAPLTDLGLTAGTFSEVVAANAGLVKVIKVEDLDNYVLECVIVNHSLRDDG